MATTYYQDIQKLYVAYFNRPADSAGLAYWEGVVEGLGGSTAAVSAAFSQENEYKDAYAGMSNADIVDKVYQNLFGRAAESAGKDYWAGLLDQGAITIDKVVTEVARGAQGSDAVAYANKVVAAGSFTLALVTPQQQHAYSGAAANAEAKAFMSTVTDDVSLDAALSNGSLDTAIAKVVAAGTPFELAAGLRALDMAEAAHLSFLDAADGSADGHVTLTDSDLNAALDASIAALNNLVPGGDLVQASPGVRAALLADARAAVEQEVSDANKAMFDANASLGRMSGLVDAVSVRTAAIAAADAADAAAAEAVSALQAEAAAYNLVHASSITVNPNGTVEGLIVLDDAGQLALAGGVTEQTNAGIGALLAASIGRVQAAVADVAAVHAADSAVEKVNYLDMGAVEKADLQAIAAAVTSVHLPANALPTLAQIGAQQEILDAAAAAAAQAVSDAGPNATPDQVDAANAAAAAASGFHALSETYHTHFTANARVDAANLAKAGLQAALADAATLDAAVGAMNRAGELVAGLKFVNAGVDDVNQAFADHGFGLPQFAHGVLSAGAGADVFLADGSDASIAQFGLQGADALYVHAGYTLGSDPAHGNDALLEAFIVQDGADTRVVLEHDPAASNAATPGVTTITLTGVDATHVHLADGVITLS